MINKLRTRELGATGKRATILGFGTGRLHEISPGKLDMEKSAAVVRRGLELGINYIDTALVYHDGQSERAIGMAIDGVPRNSFYLTTKLSVNSQEDSQASAFRQKLEKSLGHLKTPYVDFVLLHGLQWDAFRDSASKPGMALDEARKAQSEGLIGHIGFSSHDTLENVLQLIRTGEFELLLRQYNYLDRYNEPAFELAAQHRVAVTVMGPAAAGKLVEPGEIVLGGEQMKAAELALRFVYANPHVDVAVSGMNSIEQLEENLSTALAVSGLDVHAEPGDQAEFVLAYVSEKQAQADEYCSLCGKCLPCPNDVHVVENFRYMNWHQVWGMPEAAKKAYAALNNEKGSWEPYAGLIKGLKAEACKECGECEPKCPQSIPIIQQLKETAAVLRTE